MQVKKAEIQKVFKKLKLETRSTTHQYGWFSPEGRKILRVHFSHGKGDLPGRVSDKIRSQLRLFPKGLQGIDRLPAIIGWLCGHSKAKGVDLKEQK